MQLFVKIYNDKSRFLTTTASSYKFLSQVIIFKSSFYPKQLFWRNSVIAFQLPLSVLKRFSTFFWLQSTPNFSLIASTTFLYDEGLNMLDGLFPSRASSTSISSNKYNQAYKQKLIKNKIKTLITNTIKHINKYNQTYKKKKSD